MEERVRQLNKERFQKGNVIYWMSRDQRVNNNWALLFAQKIAKEKKSSVIVVFCLTHKFLEATKRQYGFMLRGLEELQKDFHRFNIPFHLILGEPQRAIPIFLKNYNGGVLVSDFDPLKIKEQWKKEILDKIRIPFYEVDAHNIVPCWIASSKQEYGAYTLRPKINKKLNKFLVNFPRVKKQQGKFEKPEKIKPDNLLKNLKIDKKIEEIEWLKSGEKEAKKVLNNFLKKISSYSKDKNNPNKNALSNLSPYLHFGQISSQEIALKIKKTKSRGRGVFLEELIIRKELSDNFCFYNKNYDSIKGAPAWARKTLEKHKKDKRKYSYTLKKLENAETHDDLWNASQLQMVKTGKMHGYLRMYWAKKILEWSRCPEEAIKNAIYLNDRYELDGRDPNGYTGIAWSICGVHDRAWGERPVFGKIRYMSYEGMKNKFDVKKFIKNYEK